jgi:hypothetical protein
MKNFINQVNEKVLNEFIKCLDNGTVTSFKIMDKKETKDYLINFVNLKK